MVSKMYKDDETSLYTSAGFYVVSRKVVKLLRYMSKRLTDTSF